MIPPFDIFRVEGSDEVVWIDAVSDLDAARALIKTQMRMAPAEYLIHSRKTGNQISIKPTDGDGGSTQASR